MKAFITLALSIVLAPIIACGIASCASIAQSAPATAPTSSAAPAINLAPRMYYTGDTCALRDMRTGALYPVSCDLSSPIAPDERLRQWQVKQP